MSNPPGTGSIFSRKGFYLPDDPRTRWPTFVIHRDAYLLVKEARRLSHEAKAAIAKATPHLYGLEISCSEAVADELLTWFDDCAAHYTILGRPFAWIVKASHRARDSITRALSSPPRRLSHFAGRLEGMT